MIFKAKTNKSFRNLWVTLALAFLALSALVLLISNSLNMYFSLHTQQELITNEQKFIAQNAADTVQNFIQEKFRTLKAVAHLSDPVETNREKQDLILEKLLGLEPAFRQAVLLNAKEEELAKVSRLSSSVSGQLTERVSSDLLSQASQMQTYISPVYIDEITSEPLVIMAVSVTNTLGDFEGVLLAEVNLKFMWDLVGGIKVGDQGLAYVVDKSGNLLAAGDTSRVLRGENLAHLKEVNEFVNGGIKTHKNSAEITKGFQGNFVVANHAHLGTPDWAVIVELPVLEAYETVITTLLLSGLIILLSFALAIVFGVYLSKRITKPITVLKDAAAKIGEGKLDIKIEIEKKDEIGVLSAAFNQMAHDLQRTTTSIEDLNREIEERNKTEEALRKNEEFTRRVIESSHDCIIVLDLDGHLLSMSGGGQKLLEIDNIKPYLNSSFIDFWKGKEREDCLKAISKAKQGDIGIFYGYFETAKNTPKWWEVVVTPIKDANGNINRLLATSHDITERKTAEKSLEKLNKDLKSTIALLTQSNRQLQEFTYSAAHDLKTPLRGISTLAQWLAEDYREKFDDKGRHQVDMLIKRVERIIKLINALLHYSTITNEKHKGQPVDLNTLVGEILVDIRPPSNIKIIFNKNLPAVVCRKAHLQQVFYHLITNAIKFIDKPEGHIAIDYIEKDNLWEFSVSDNGPGIAPQHFERIFRIFQVLGDSYRSEGCGIGLTIVRKIVELYDGQLWLASEIGQGSTFFFTLPKRNIEAEDEKLEESLVG